MENRIVRDMPSSPTHRCLRSRRGVPSDVDHNGLSHNHKILLADSIPRNPFIAFKARELPAKLRQSNAHRGARYLNQSLERMVQLQDQKNRTGYG